jgi:alkylhydroperoxidase family enzyme
MMTRYAPGRAEGVTEELVAALEGYEGGPFTEREKAAFRYADRMYENHHAVDDAMFAMLRDHYTDDEILELSWAIAEFIALGKMIRVFEIPYGMGSLEGPPKPPAAHRPAP